jgi:hypothetical protein
MEGPYWFYYVARSTNQHPEALAEAELIRRLESELPRALHRQGLLQPVYHFAAHRGTWLVCVLVAGRDQLGVEPAQRAIQLALPLALGATQFIRCGSVPATLSRRQPPQAA